MDNLQTSFEFDLAEKDIITISIPFINETFDQASEIFAYFNDNGKKLFEAFDDKEIQQIAWDRYGFRTGISGGRYDVSSIGIGVPQTISSTVSSLKMDTYNKLIEYLKNGGNN